MQRRRQASWLPACQSPASGGETETKRKQLLQGLHKRFCRIHLNALAIMVRLLRKQGPVGSYPGIAALASPFVADHSTTCSTRVLEWSQLIIRKAHWVRTEKRRQKNVFAGRLSRPISHENAFELSKVGQIDLRKKSKLAGSRAMS